MRIKRMGLNPKDIEAWREGEGDELRKWIGFGFYKTKFSTAGTTTTITYDAGEVAEFEKVLEKKLDEKLFNEMCDRLFELIGENEPDVKTKIMPMLTIFDEISKYPEWGNARMMRRLERVRKTTHNFSYNAQNP